MYKYIPDTHDQRKIDGRFSDNEEFVKTQKEYKSLFENYLYDELNFEAINLYVMSRRLDIPVIQDHDYNFYHDGSGLRNQYIYVRNNYHVERLSDEDLETLRSGNADEEYLKRTMASVLFEEPDKAFFGPATLDYLADSESIVFEFAFDQKRVETIEELNKIKLLKEDSFKVIGDQMQKSLQIPVSFFTYNGIPEMFKKERVEQQTL